MKLKTLIKDPSSDHTHTVVFLHGRGDNVANFTRALAYLIDSNGYTLWDSFPSFRWVFPEAEMCSVASSGERWHQWFDVWNVRDFKEQEMRQSEGLKQSVPCIREILMEEADLLNGQWDKIILAGISQGAATSVHTLINLAVPMGASVPPGLCAFIGYSCRMPFAGRDLEETRQLLGLDDVPQNADLIKNTPMMLQHCVNDPLVLIEHGRQLCNTLTGFGAQVKWIEYPSGGHWFNSPTGVDDTVRFLKTVVGEKRKATFQEEQHQKSKDVMDTT